MPRTTRAPPKVRFTVERQQVRTTVTLFSPGSGSHDGRATDAFHWNTQKSQRKRDTPRMLFRTLLQRLECRYCVSECETSIQILVFTRNTIAAITGIHCYIVSMANKGKINNNNKIYLRGRSVRVSCWSANYRAFGDWLIILDGNRINFLLSGS